MSHNALNPEISAEPIVVISIEPEPANAIQQAVLEGLRAFNEAHAGANRTGSLTLAARDSAGSVVGGLVGEIAWKWLYVSRLWVDANVRGKGIGRELLRAAEREAASRGCGGVYLSTFDFQARPFYETEGYVLFGTLPDFPPGHDRFYLRKVLSPVGGSGTRDSDTAPATSPGQDL